MSWAMYDMANQFFVLNIVSLYFVRWVMIEKQTLDIFYSITFGVSTFFVAIAAPILGAVADENRRYRPFFIYFTLLCILFTMLLSVVDNIFLALFFFAIANIGCQTAAIFYNALMLTVSPKNRIGLVSGLGKMLGYLGAIIALIFTRSVAAERGYHAVFFLTGVLFFIFSLPALIFIKDEHPARKISLRIFLKKETTPQIFKRLKGTLLSAGKFSGLGDFLKAMFFGLCMINVCMLFMSVYIIRVFKLGDVEIIDFIAFSAIFALAGSIISGILSDRLGYKWSMIIVFLLWILCILGAGLLDVPYQWLIGALGGVSLGATWVVSRALVINIIPREKIAEVFGLFNLVGYLSAIVGPVIWGIAVLRLAPLGALGYRISLLLLLPFMVIGMVFLMRIRK